MDAAEGTLKIRRFFLIGGVLLAVGAWLILTYCQGSIGGQAGDHISAFSIKIDMTTTGYPAVFGLPAALLGAFLLLVGVIATVVLEVRSAFSRTRTVVKRPKAIVVEEPRNPL